MTQDTIYESLKGFLFKKGLISLNLSQKHGWPQEVNDAYFSFLQHRHGLYGTLVPTNSLAIPNVIVSDPDWVFAFSPDSGEVYTYVGSDDDSEEDNGDDGDEEDEDEDQVIEQALADTESVIVANGSLDESYPDAESRDKE